MMTLKFRSVLFAVLTVAVGASAEDAPSKAPVLSLDHVLSEVLSNNPAIKSARSSWEAMKQRVPQARAWEDPRLGFDTSFYRFVDVMPNSFTDQKLMVEQSIPVAGKNRLRGEAASAEALSAYHEIRRRQLELIVKARTAYFQLANAYQQLELNQKNIALLKQIADISRSRYEVGSEAQSDVLAAETEQAKLEETVFDTKRQISDAETELNTLMNRPPHALPKPEPLVFRNVELSLDTLQQIALTNRPDFFIAKKKIEAAQTRVELAKRDWWPDPSLRLEADRYNDTSHPVSELMAGVAINIPWFHPKKYRAAIEENKKMVESAEQELEALRTDTLGMVKTAFKKAETFHHHTELFRNKLLPLAQETVTSKRLSYETQKGAFLDLLMAQRTLQEVESMYWSHLTDYQSALAELEAVVGTKLVHADTEELTKESK